MRYLAAVTALAFGCGALQLPPPVEAGPCVQVEHHRKSTTYWIGDQVVDEWTLARRMRLAPDARAEADAVHRWFIGGFTLAAVGLASWAVGFAMLIGVATQPRDHQDSTLVDVGLGLAVPGFVAILASPFMSIPRHEHLRRAIGQYNEAADRGHTCPIGP